MGRKKTNPLWLSDGSIGSILHTRKYQKPDEILGLTNPLGDIKNVSLSLENPSNLIPTDWNDLVEENSKEVIKELGTPEDKIIPAVAYRLKGSLHIISGIERVYAAKKESKSIYVVSIDEETYRRFRLSDVEWEWYLLDITSHERLTFSNI